MAVIDLDISELMSIYDNLEKTKKLLDTYYHDVSEVLSSLNLKVAARSNIDESLKHIQKCLKTEKDYIGTCATQVKKVIDSFQEKAKTHDLPEYSFHVESIKPGMEVDDVFVGGAMHGTPDPFTQQFEDIRLRMTEEVEQIFMNNMYNSKVEDISSYSKYIQM